MGLYDTLSQIDEMSLQQQASRTVPPPGSPQRPNVAYTPAATPAPAPAKKSKGLLWFLGGETEAVAAGVIRSPAALLGGIAGTLQDTDHWAQDNLDPNFVRSVHNAYDSFTQSPVAQAIAPHPNVRARQRPPQPASLQDVISLRSTLGQVGDPTTNQFTAEGGAILIGAYGGESALAQGLPMATRVARLLSSSARVGLATGIAADTHGGGLPARAVNAAEGAALNLVAEPLLGVLHNFIASKIPTRITVGSAKDALGDKLDRAFASARTKEARYQAEEAASNGPEAGGSDAKDGATGGAEELPAGTRHTDAQSAAPQETAAKPPKARGRGVDAQEEPQGDPELDTRYQDANNALKASGRPEKVTPEANPLNPDGTIPVDPVTKKAMDEAGLGRSFAAANETPKDMVVFKEEDANGGARVVGTMGKEDLQAFKDDVEEFRHDAAPAELNVPPEHPVGQWKLSNLGAPYDTAPFLRALAEQLPERETLTDAEVMAQAKATADAVGWDPEEMLAYAAHVAGSVKQLPQVMATIRTVYTRAASMVDELVDRQLNWTELSDDHPDLKEALAAVHNVVTLGQSVAETKSGVGGALRIAGLPDADTFLEQFGKDPAPKPVDPLDGLPRLPRTKDELKQWLDAWEYTRNDPVARDKFLQGLTFMPGKWLALRTSFANWFTAAIISAPSTFMRDLLGPATIGTLRTLERTAGGYAASINPMVAPELRRELLAQASAAIPAYVQTLGAAKDALKAAVKATIDQGSLLRPGENLYDLHTRPIPQGLIDAAIAKEGPGVTGDLPYVFANAINYFPQWVHALHGGVNEFAQRLSYLGEVRSSALVEAAQQGLKGDDLTKFVRDTVQNSTDEVTWAAKDPAALASSERTTLIKSVANPATQPIMSKFIQFVQSMRTNFPETRYVLPIFTIPANALGETLRRIPFLGQTFRETQQELTGAFGAARQAEAYGRFLTGASILTAGSLLGRAGLLTGAGPQEASARRLWDAQGFQPYSLRIGDHWVSFNRLDVIGSMLAIPADFMDKSVHTQADNQHLAYASVAALAQYLKDQAALQGVADVLSFGGSPLEAQGFLDRLKNQVARGFVPNFITQMGRNNLDPQARTVRSAWDSILNALPGASKLLDPQRNMLGEETDKIQNAGFNTLPVNISNVNTYAKDSVLDELDRVYQVTGFAPGVKSPALPGSHEDMRDIKLEDGHSLYDALMRYRTRAQVDGQPLRGALQELIDSPEYNAAVDGDANNSQTEDGREIRGAMITKVFQEFDREAAKSVANASPAAARYLAIGAAKRANDYALRDHTAHDLAQNPSLLSALGVNLQDYEDRIKGQ